MFAVTITCFSLSRFGFLCIIICRWTVELPILGWYFLKPACMLQRPSFTYLKTTDSTSSFVCDLHRMSHFWYIFARAYHFRRNVFDSFKLYTVWLFGIKCSTMLGISSTDDLFLSCWPGCTIFAIGVDCETCSYKCFDVSVLRRSYLSVNNDLNNDHIENLKYLYTKTAVSLYWWKKKINYIENHYAMYLKTYIY